MRTLASFVSGRRSRWVVLALWIALVAALGPLAGKFEGAQQNEQASFLPGSAESVRVLEAERGFGDGRPTVAAIVLRNPDGLTRADRRAVESVRPRLAASADTGLGDPSRSFASADGRALLVNVPIVANGDVDLLVHDVDTTRSVLERSLPRDLEAKVTGPAGFSADASRVFDGINSTLLYSAALLVFVHVFWVLPLLAVFFAEGVVRALGYLLAQGGVVINGQVGGILLILVFGAGTDYALLLTARYREELGRVESKYDAMRIAVRQAAPAILASAGTVIAALLCLSLAELDTTAALGPVGATGIAVAALAMLTLLPTFLLIGGRAAFWPFVPRHGSADAALMLMLAVVLSFFAALGLSLIGFRLFTDFPGEDPSYALYAFIFLVALGVDYSIFLMARVRDEAARLPTRDAMLRALAVTGGVITSAGVVLAGTFLVLAVLPLVALTQLGVTVAVGVLLDTLVVRSILLPALTFDLGELTWWPARLWHERPERSRSIAQA
jgi:uncharacterized membrane protein YdfJ with MMPL/SSD domain